MKKEAKTFVILALLPGGAFAQAIERNLPPSEQADRPIILAPNVTPNNEDNHTIVSAVQAIVILGPADTVQTNSSQRVDTRRVVRLDTSAGRAALQPFIGKPLSHKLIAEIEARIARFYRNAGFPFVSLSTPPQIIGGGMLQIRVVEFHDGAVTVSGVKRRTAGRIIEDIRLKPGQPIDADLLSDDLDWLNRSPFHHVEAVFSPGDALGSTNLDLQVTQTRPWQVYTGYANSGSKSTGYSRLLLGAQVGDLLVRDSLFSYQFTTSPDFFGDTSHPDYLSHGVRAEIPIAPRQDIEASFDYVATQSTAEPFVVRQVTEELSVGYRTSLSNYAAIPGDFTLGVQAKREQHTTFFSDVDVVNGAVQVFQIYAGWSDAWSDPSGKTAISLTLYESPGGVDNHNGAQAFAGFTNGRVSDGNYQYANIQLSRTTRLPGQWAVANLIIAQYADAALPDTEQAGIGGADLVRGYTLDDRAYDRAIVSRNELRSPTFPLLAGALKRHDQLSPFVFVDAGYGSDRVTRLDVHAVSAGVGADYQFGSSLSANVTGAYAFTNGVMTRSGDARVEAKVTLTF